MNRTHRAFTLIELLIVVAIIAILAAIAIPNFLEAQTRSKISAARANLRVTWDALQIYQLDNNAYPPTEPVFPDDPLALLADRQLWRLTTPVAYTSAASFRDPFGTARLYSLFADSTTGGGLFPPNQNQALLYYNYLSTSDRLSFGSLSLRGFGIVSIGPDLEDSLGAFCNLPEAEFQGTFIYSPIRKPIDTLYDATNGTASAGDIVRLHTGEFADLR